MIFTQYNIILRKMFDRKFNCFCQKQIESHHEKYFPSRMRDFLFLNILHVK